MHVIIFHQQVIFTYLISFYKCFNDMYFTHVILLLRSNTSRYPKMKNGYQRTTLLSFSLFYFLFIIIIIIFGGGAVGFVFLTFLIFKAY